MTRMRLAAGLPQKPNSAIESVMTLTLDHSIPRPRPLTDIIPADSISSESDTSPEISPGLEFHLATFPLNNATLCSHVLLINIKFLAPGGLST